MVDHGIGILAYGILNLIVVLILSIPLFFALFGLVRFLRSRKWLKAPVCEKCGAQIAPHDDVCPSCGEATRCAAHRARKGSSLTLLIIFSVLFTAFASFGIFTTVRVFSPGYRLEKMLSQNGGAYDKASLLNNSGPYWKCLIVDGEEIIRYDVIKFANSRKYEEYEVKSEKRQTSFPLFPVYTWDYGKLENAKATGKYSVDNNKTLTITLSDGTVKRYSFNEKNKLDGDTWYIGDKTLYLGVREYERFNDY